jgi:hypothetical protein
LPGTESTISGFSYTGLPQWNKLFLEYSTRSKPFLGPSQWTELTPPQTSNYIFSAQISAGHAETLRDHSYPPKGLQFTGRNAIGPRGHYRLTSSGSATATKEITADTDPQAPTSPSPLVLDSTTMSVVVPRKLGPKSDAEKSASKQLRQAGGACMKHRLGKKRVCPHCSPKIKNPR